MARIEENNQQNHSEARARLDPHQRALLTALNDIHPELGRAYLGAVLVLSDPSNPARAYQAAHMARDICDRINQYLGFPRHKDRRQRLAKLLYVDPNDPVVKNWLDVHRKLTELAHLRGPDEDPPKMEDVRREFARFEYVLSALLRPFYEHFEDLDQLLAVEEPTNEDIQTLLILLTRRGTARRAYFFDNLKYPKWLSPLYKEGFFRKPPAPVGDEREGTITFLRWAESEYLVRMAKEEPQIVRDIILETMEEAERAGNPRVLENFVDAALAMPANVAADIADRTQKWDKRYYILLPAKLGALMRKLADETEATAAGRLASWLLAVHSDERRREEQAAGVVFRTRSEPRSWIRDSEYGQIIQEHFPSIVRAAPSQACDLICNILESAVRIREGKTEGPDYSYIWLPALESHEQNIAPYDVKEILAFAARDALECWAGKSPEEARGFIERLLQHPYSIFRRLAMHVIRVSREHFGDLAARVLSNQEFFDDSEVWHDYFLLSRAHFAKLTGEQQNQILEWIEAGPDAESFRRSHQTFWGTEPSEEEVRRHRKHWILRRLSALKGMLPLEWEAKYDCLVSELGEPDHPDFVSYSTGAQLVGPRSPKTKEQLASMPVEDLIAFLQEYHAPSGPDPEHTLTGLGETLEQVVKEDPKRYAEAASRFAQPHIRPIYLYYLLYGLEQAWKGGNDFLWGEVLTLCDLVVERRDKPPAEGQQPLLVPDYVDARGEVANLLNEAMARDDHAVGPEHMPRIRDTLLRLICDLHPTEQDEQKWYPDHDPYTVSINVVRGKAMHALITYALRYARLHKEGGEEGSFAPGHRMEGQVKAALTEKLDKSKDPSPAVHSIFGLFLANLFYLDWEWTEEHLGDIFPLEPHKEVYWEAAWGAYMCFGQFFKELYPILRPQYRRAIDRLKKEPTGKGGLADPTHHLAHHLTAAYWHGLEELEGKDFLLPLFHENASDEVRSAAIWHLAEGLEKLEEIEQREPGARARIWGRLRKLWESRVAAASKAADISGFTKELASFARWLEFVLEDADTLSPLIESILPHAAKQWHGHYVLEYLQKQAKDNPTRSVGLLLRLVEPEDARAYMFGREAEIEAILRAAMKSGDTKARADVEKAINLFGERGDHQYRTLLEP